MDLEKIVGKNWLNEREALIKQEQRPGRKESWLDCVNPKLLIKTYNQGDGRNDVWKAVDCIRLENGNFGLILKPNEGGGFYAFILTDGVDIYQTYLLGEMPVSEFLRTKIGLILGKDIHKADDKVLIDVVENDITALMIDILREIMSFLPQKVDLIGIEGPTIAYDVQKKYTYQLGKSRQIFEEFHIPVVSHFHNADISNGGQGSPICATYYQALSALVDKPALFVNIGGQTSLTYIGCFGEMLSFDCGPGNEMLNNFMKKHAHVAMDYNGRCAASGVADEKIISALMQHEFFKKMPPKALDRRTFDDKTEHCEGLSIENGAATITAFIAESIVQSICSLLPEKPETIIICGGGAANPTLVRTVKQKLKLQNMKASTFDADVKPDDAACIAFLAARRLYQLPITFPSTTGVSAPLIGGKIYDKESTK